MAKLSARERQRARRLPRRRLLAGGGALALSTLANCTRGHAPEPADLLPGDTPLLSDPDGLLELPEGYSYRVVQRAGAEMSDGYRAPGRPDAMCCFAGPRGALTLMRNHELWQGHEGQSPFWDESERPAECYDPRGTGGVTRLVLDPHTLELQRSNLVLAGTLWNCAGGPSPFGFLSCEETFEADHGYVFLCPIESESLQPAQRIDGYGRFRHEAAAVDPRTHIAYLTEDRPDAGFYRFVPERKEAPFAGVLQALRAIDAPGLDTGELRTGERVMIDWVDIEAPAPEDDSVRLQAQAAGGALFRRTEGLWLTEAAAFITATEGGPLGRGQVFRLSLRDPAVLEVIAASNDPELLDMPDNLCASRAGLLYVAEDGYDGNSVRRIWPDGRITSFARNAGSPNEFAGPCFSPDGKTLFINVQEDGLTLAIRGPFQRDEAIARAQARGLGRSRARLSAGLGALALSLALGCSPV